MNCNPNTVSRPFTQRNIERLPNDAFGIYGLWCNGICLYIGKAERQPIKKRLMDHFMNCQNPDLKDWLGAFSKEIRFAVKPVANRKEIHGFERKFIALYAPRTNRTK